MSIVRFVPSKRLSPGMLLSAVAAAMMTMAMMLAANAGMATAATEDASSASASAPAHSLSSLRERRQQRRPNRNLHIAPFAHSHYYQPPWRPQPQPQWQPQLQSQSTIYLQANAPYTTAGTEAPTSYSEDDEYYTDDGAIDADMVRERKELYESESESEHANENSDGDSVQGNIIHGIKGHDNYNFNNNDKLDGERDPGPTSAAAVVNPLHFGSVGVGGILVAWMLLGWVPYRERDHRESGQFCAARHEQCDAMGCNAMQCNAAKCYHSSKPGRKNLATTVGWGGAGRGGAGRGEDL
eukprot:jgi/Psemu1/60771/gm1.60771_g